MKRNFSSLVPPVPSKSEEYETFAVLYTKVSGRKHKKWDNDGLLIIENKRRFKLKSMDGEVQTSGMVDASEYMRVVDCEELVLGRFDVQVQHLVTESLPTPSLPTTPSPKYNMKTFVSSVAEKRARLHNSMLNKNSPSTKSNVLQTKPAVNCLELRQPGEDGFPEGVKVSAKLSSELRPHQQEGIKFLFDKLRNAPSGAILADEMGLGKTIQTISVVHTMLNTKQNSRKMINKVLILCPLALRENWRAEFSKWIGCNNICYIPSSLDDLNRYWATSLRVPVCIINYDMVKAYAKQLRQMIFDIVVCDEAHILKKVDGKIRETIESLNIPRRILLTGTPIQNSLREFYDLSLLVNKNMFVNFKDFVEQLNEKGGEIISRFMLRRSCDINQKFLPPRYDYLIFCRPSKLQDNVLNSALNSLIPNSLTLIQALRLVCNHPAFLFRNIKQGKFSNISSVMQAFPESFDVNSLQVCDSSKMRTLLNMISGFRAEGDKTVIVSNFTSTLDLIEVLLKSVKFSVCRLDGSLAGVKRLRLVNDFNANVNPNEIFLLSSAAGGTGLNLIGANRLIMFDCSWNPAVDLQAMARIWRDGQKKDVHIYRLFTAGTIEEKILQRQIKKVGISTIVNPVAVYEDTSEENLEFDDADLEDILTFDSVSCQTHELIQCNCDENGKNVYSDINDDEILDETETSEQPSEEEKHALDVVKNLGVMKEERKAPRASVAELLRWKHFGGETEEFVTLKKTIGLQNHSEQDDVTFIMLLEPKQKP